MQDREQFNLDLKRVLTAEASVSGNDLYFPQQTDRIRVHLRPTISDGTSTAWMRRPVIDGRVPDGQRVRQ
jgi:hypothetical protein